MNVFLSVGATYSDEQERFVSAFEQFLSRNGCVRLTVGRGSEGARQPILQARDLMATADAVIVIAFTRLRVVQAFEKPGSNEQEEITERKYPTVWNQLEAAMGFGLNLPLLVIMEKGLHEEAMLKDRMEFRVLYSPLDPALFSSVKFQQAFDDFKTITEKRAAERKAAHAADFSDKWTMGQFLGNLRPDQFWKVGAALFSVLAAVAAAAFWLGRHLPR